MDARDTPDVRQQMDRIETLVQTLEATADPAMQTCSRELMQAVLDLHSAGLERLLTLAYERVGQGLIDALAEDEIVSGLMLLHGLHPLSLEARVENALETVRPHLGSHGGGVELLGVTDDGIVRLRLEGNCHGCPSSRVTLSQAVETAIYEAAPDVAALDVEGATDAPRPAATTVEWLDCPLPDIAA